MLLGDPATAPHAGAPRLLLVKARIDDHDGEASAPALGTMYLGAVAREIGWDARCIDTYLEDDPERALISAIRELSPQVIGISALTAEQKWMHRLARIARKAAPTAVILAGGAHASADPEDVVRDEAFDAAVMGEGELTLQDVLGRIARGEGWQDAAGLVVRDDAGGVRHNPDRPYIADLDTLPMPAWDLTDPDAYARRRGMSLSGLRRYMPITTSRGCPYKCTYCHDVHGKRFRSNSAEYVLRMVDDLRSRLGIHTFDITDDIFNFDADRMMEICDGFIARGPGLAFTCPNGIRADRMTVAQADKMARAGCEYVAIAIETATKRLQKQIKKHLRFDKVRPIITALTDRNVLTAGFFMVGFPTETEAELRATIDFAVSSRLHAAYFFVVTPFGGTVMHEEIVTTMSSEAVQLTGTGMYYRPTKNLSNVPDPRFFKLRRDAYLRFYIDPRRMARIWRAHPRKRNLLEYAATMFVRDALRIDPGRYLGWLSRARTLARRAVPAIVPREAARPAVRAPAAVERGAPSAVPAPTGAVRRHLPITSAAALPVAPAGPTGSSSAAVLAALPGGARPPLT
jgi:radical SAM superfamily enzyme YgiQ (UPF0313 family)